MKERKLQRTAKRKNGRRKIFSWPAFFQPSSNKVTEKNKEVPHDLISGTTSPKMSDTLILSLPSKTDSRHFSSLSISTSIIVLSPNSLDSVCVCTLVCVCVRACGVCVCVCVCACMCVWVYIYNFSMPVQRHPAVLIYEPFFSF